MRPDGAMDFQPPRGGLGTDPLLSRLLVIVASNGKGAPKLLNITKVYRIFFADVNNVVIWDDLTSNLSKLKSLRNFH